MPSDTTPSYTIPSSDLSCAPPSPQTNEKKTGLKKQLSSENPPLPQLWPESEDEDELDEDDFLQSF
jgi:hypothetical protein